jgi:hypothetical protein
MKSPFTVTCNSCNSTDVEVWKSIDGVYFECLNSECENTGEIIITDMEPLTYAWEEN